MSPARRQAQIIRDGLALGSACWYPHHSWIEGESERVDGYLQMGAKQLQLDVASLGDENVVARVRTCAEEPQSDWALGSVSVMAPGVDLEDDDVMTLVVPEQALTTDLIVEALHRFRP